MIEKKLDYAAAFFKLCDATYRGFFVFFFHGKRLELVQSQLQEIVLHGLLQ